MVEILTIPIVNSGKLSSRCVRQWKFLLAKRSEDRRHLLYFFVGTGYLIHLFAVLFGGLLIGMSHGPNGMADGILLLKSLAFPLSLFAVDGFFILSILNGLMWAILLVVIINRSKPEP